MTFSQLRRNNFFLVILFLIFNFSLTYGQVTVKGKLIDEKGEAMVGALASLKGTDYGVYTNALGKFTFYDVNPGEYELVIEIDESVAYEQLIMVADNELDLGDIAVKYAPETLTEADIAVVTLTDSETGDGADDQLISGILSSGRDVFEQASSFHFFSGRFRARGYQNERFHLYINGMYMNDLDDGRVLWNAWGGLNDVLRNRNSNLSLNASNIGFGGIGGSSEIDIRPSRQRPGTRIGYSFTNRSYQNRMSLTHHSGEQANGWSYSLSVSRRWGNEGYIEGTFYDANAFFASVEKKLGNHSINATFFDTPTKRGRSGGSFQEMYDLTGNNFYNPYWGFQNGEKRNSRVYRINLPVAIINHDWTISESTNLRTSLGIQTGKFGTTALDWYLAPDPRPDYYRKLPSFQLTPEAANQVADYYRSSKEASQLNWDRFYQINRNKNATIEDAFGQEGNDITGALSSYVVEEQRFDNNKLSFNSIIESAISQNVYFTGGIQYLAEKVENFKVLDDLLGGEFYVDFDEFAIRDFPGNDDVIQNDLNNPNRVIYEGDVFGWNYDINTTRAVAWSQLQYTGSKVDGHFALEVSRDGFYREGKYRNGRFPDSSFGDSDKKTFNNISTKGGLTYKIDGRNYLYGNATYRQKSPFSRFSYLSARTRDEVVENLTQEKMYGGEAGYILRFPSLKGRVTAYYTQFEDQIDNFSFYHDEERTFVNYTMSGIDARHMGIELGLQGKIGTTIEVEGALALGDYIYTSRPRAAISQDNDARVIDTDRTVYINNYKVPGMPQNAATLGLTYLSPKFWLVSMNVNYFGKNFLDFNPDRRTTVAVDLVSRDENPELWNDIIGQEELDSQITVDLFARKSWRVDNYYIVVFASVNNLLDVTDFITGGFEQYRFDYEGKDTSRFPPRYFYAFGRNFSLNFGLSF